MAVPVSLLASLADIESFDREAFEKIHASGLQVTSIRINPAKQPGWFRQSNSDPAKDLAPFGQSSIPAISPIPWTKYGLYLSERPSFTFDPLFHAGCYYVQEASSMFLEQALRQTTDITRSLKVLDLSAAPGGKSTHLQSLISEDSLLVSNEVIRSRAGILKDNIIKWGCRNVMVSNNDPKDFSKLAGYFDVMVVDAPCSGSGLFRRDPEAIGEWSLQNVQLCSQRQQRILADAWPALKEGGVLIYSTCSYSKEEDEDIVKWMLKELPVNTCPLEIDPAWGIAESGGGYRFWPDKVKGEGFFIACFRKTGEEDEVRTKTRNKPDAVASKEKDIIAKWSKTEDIGFIKKQQTVYAWPARLENDLSFLLNELRILYSGTIIGELVRDKLVPDHALAMSNLVRDTVGITGLDYENAIQYLRRKEITIGTDHKGWQAVSYEGHLLGWMNVLHNRINNYYPKELRILKDN